MFGHGRSEDILGMLRDTSAGVEKFKTEAIKEIIL